MSHAAHLSYVDHHNAAHMIYVARCHVLCINESCRTYKANSPACYVCMYACMCVCLYICIFVCLFVCMYVCFFVCLYVCMFVCIHACMRVCMYVCMYACMHVYMNVCVHVCICVRSLKKTIESYQKKIALLCSTLLFSRSNFFTTSNP